MNNCIFCQIVGNPSKESQRIIYEDNKYLGMLVSHPETNGHIIIFPKAHMEEMSEMSDAGEFFELAVELAEKLTEKLAAKAYVLKLNNKIYKLEDDPLHVGHIHIHVVPRFVKDKMKENPGIVNEAYYNNLKRKLVKDGSADKI